MSSKRLLFLKTSTHSVSSSRSGQSRWLVALCLHSASAAIASITISFTTHKQSIQHLCEQGFPWSSAPPFWGFVHSFQKKQQRTGVKVSFTVTHAEYLAVCLVNYYSIKLKNLASLKEKLKFPRLKLRSMRKLQNNGTNPAASHQHKHISKSERVQVLHAQYKNWIPAAEPSFSRIQVMNPIWKGNSAAGWLLQPPCHASHTARPFKRT